MCICELAHVHEGATLVHSCTHTVDHDATHRVHKCIRACARAHTCTKALLHDACMHCTSAQRFVCSVVCSVCACTSARALCFHAHAPMHKCTYVILKNVWVFRAMCMQACVFCRAPTCPNQPPS